MAQYADDPFQMDEDIPLPRSLVQISPNPTHMVPYTQHESDSKLTAQDIPRTPFPDKKTLRSRISLLQADENVGTTTEEDEFVCEEDADDKLDRAAVEANNGKSVLLKAEPFLSPPENFAPVINNIYRASFPQPANFPFLKTLKLKSVLCLIPEEYPLCHEEFFEQEGIKLFHLGMSGNKEPFVKISSELITEAIKIVIDPKNQPILIHCNRGKHRTGCLVGVLRRLQRWSLTIIFDEYRKFASPKERPMDQQFIELYDEREVLAYANEHKLLPLKWA